MVVVWIVLAIVLLALELHHGALYLLFGALGSLVAIVVAVIAPTAVGVQVLVAAAVAIVGIVVVRPLLRPLLRVRQDGLIARGVHGGFVGQSALSLDAIGDALHPGHVRLEGERWLAISADDQPIEAGRPVQIEAVRGTTLVVRPALEEEVP